MASQWFYQVMGSQVGSVSTAELMALAQRGTIRYDTLVRKGHNGEWVLAERVKGLLLAAGQAAPADVRNGKREDCDQLFESIITAIDRKDISRSTPAVDSQASMFLQGRQGKSLIVHGGTVKIIRKAGVFAAQREKVLPVKSITSVEVKKPGWLVAGFIQFSIGGGKARDSSYTVTGGASDAAQDENSLVFAGDDKYKVALKIQSYIAQYGQNDGHGAPQAAPMDFSVADEIAKLKRLADQGVLTKEEFEAKKKQLLGS